jgi:hypothetical protein
MTQPDARTLERAPAAPESADADRPAPLDHALVRRIIVGILLAMFLSALEQTIVAPALPTIGRDQIKKLRTDYPGRGPDGAGVHRRR